MGSGLCSTGFSGSLGLDIVVVVAVDATDVCTRIGGETGLSWGGEWESPGGFWAGGLVERQDGAAGPVNLPLEGSLTNPRIGVAAFGTDNDGEGMSDNTGFGGNEG